MRIAPVALLAFSDLQQAAQLAQHTARITHTHELGMEGTVLQACAIAFLLQQDQHTPFDSQTFLQVLHDHVHTPTFHDKLRQIQTLLPVAHHEEVVQQLGNGIAAFEAVPAALYAFLRQPDSFTEAVFYAISLGSDTDTIASMTGALTGAYLGEQAIPVMWRACVEGAVCLRDVADALLAMALRAHRDSRGIETC
jgi:poly(ADP-ribose) glycohydrolase ARH3